MPGNLMYKYLPYALGRQKYVLELAAGICILSAQRWLFTPPFAVSFPCKGNKRKYEVTFTAVFEHNSCAIIVDKVTRKHSWHSLQDQGSSAISFSKLYIDIWSVFTHVTSIYANLLEQKKAFA